MEYTAKYITPDIKLSSYEDKLFKSDIIFDQHMLVWFISGETKIIQADATYVFKTGDIFLIPRNQLSTIINYPTHGQPHKTVVMHLSPDRLKQYYEEMNRSTPVDTRRSTQNALGISMKPGILCFSNHPLLESCLMSLIPYFDMQGPFPEDLASIKINEAITILRTINKDIDNVLANFEEPGKIDLVGFMEKNFMFNMPIEKFGYMTGRSLTTFKRDFKKAFNMTPQKWLTQKRLNLAHYHLSEKRSKPMDVCYEVGFENLSHFSFAFKKQFGYPPSALTTHA